MRSLRLALFGIGTWGRCILKGIEGLPGAEIAWVVNRTAARPAGLPPSIAVCSDWRDLVDSGVADAVLIATPAGLHAEMASHALRGGLPVFVEKPLGLQLGDALRVIHLAHSAALPLLVDHVHLHSPAFEAVAARVRGDGGAEEIMSTAGNWGPFRPDTSVLFDWAPHDLAMAVELLGPGLVMLEAHSRVPSTHLSELLSDPLPQQVVLRLENAAGVPVHITVSNGLPGKARCFAVRTRCAWYRYLDGPDGPAATVESLQQPAEVKALDFVSERSLDRALDRFVQAARLRLPRPEWLQSAGEVSRLLEAAQTLIG
jgi:predicted dehydrogenase